MSTAEIAIIISVFSVIFAAVSLGWNIYRDVILKPKVVVSFDKKNIIVANRGPSPDFIGIHAVNHGPGPVILNTVVLKDTSIWKKITRKQNHAVLIHDYENPYSGKMPSKLEVGESIDLFVNYDNECFIKNNYSDLGISDSFGRTNWASRKYMAKLRKKWLENFE
jgi:hypothetical protein